MDAPTRVEAKPRKRWLARVAYVLAGLVLLLLVLPFALGPILQKVVRSTLEERLGAHVELRKASFAWPAHVELHGLELYEPTGEPLALLDEAHARVGLFALLRGAIHADVEVLGPELHVRRDADGRWNWQRILEQASGSPESEPEEEEGAKRAPDVKARVALQDGEVVVHGPTGETRLEAIDFHLSIDDLATASPFELRLALRGPQGPAGRIGLDGSFTAATDGQLDVEGFQGNVRLELVDLQLGGLAPALALVAPVEGPTGTCSGSAELALGRGLALQGSSAITARDLLFAGPRPGAKPTRLSEVVLNGQAALDGQGSGTQHLELRADSILSLVYDGRSSLGADGSGDVSGTLVLGGDLSGMTEAARPWAPIQEGVRVSGKLEQRVELSGRFQSRRPTSFEVRASGRFADLAGVDARGRAIDLAALQRASLELHVAGDAERGALVVDTLSLAAGPVALHGHVAAEGVWNAAPGKTLEISDGELQLDADLERLRGTLGQLVEIDPRSFGGTLTARATVGGDPSALRFQTQVDGRDLALFGTSLASVKSAMHGSWSADGAVDMTGTLELGALEIAQGDAAEPVRIPGATARLEGRRDAAGTAAFSTEVRMAEDLVLALEGGGDPAQGMRSSLRLDARLGPLCEIARPLAPGAEGIDGQLHGEGEVTVALAPGGSGAPGRCTAKMTLAASDLARRDEQGLAVALGLLGAPKVTLEADFDQAAGTLALPVLSLDVGEQGELLRGRVSGRVVGLSGPASEADIEDGRLELDADLARLGPELGRLLGRDAAPIGGSPLHAAFTVASKGGRVEARGDVTAPEVTIARESGPLAVHDLAVALDLVLDHKAGDLELRTARVKTSTAQLDATARLEKVLEPAAANGKVTVDLGADLGALLADLGLEPADAGRKTSGRLAGRFELEGDSGTFELSGTTSIEGFRLEVATPAKPPEPGAKPARPAPAKPTVIEQEKIQLELGASVALASRRVEIERAAIDSGLVRGGLRGALLLPESGSREVEFQGCTGEVAYVPGKLGAVVAPWLPGRWEGETEERATFTLDGKADPLDPQSLLANSRGHVDIGIGRFVRPEIELSGKLSLDDQHGTTTLRGDLQANGGTLEIDGLLDLAPEGARQTSDAPPRTRLTVKSKDVRANSGLAPLLSILHPAFATTQLAGGQLAGTIGLTLDVTYDGPLTLDTLQAGWATLPKSPIDGTGRFELAGASLSGSPALKLLAEFGFDAQRSLDLHPIEFTIRNGRVSYAKPWAWTMSGSETTFTGSVGLDETLDLAWNVPINDALVGRWGFLDALRGETISLPLRGSVRAPRLDTEDLLKDLATKAARAQLGGRLGLGGGGGGAKDDPGSLLSQADDLWNAGKKSEAAAIYKRLRDDFKLSVVYALNKDRIKDRSRWQEQPK